ncbi:hypothetical protein M8C11_18835 [Micromonospora sp. CPM1]|uniref:hypothetical protein n=1 Tax=Micromonospora sp. CPM1 TaxID=2944809 RepID=UPI00207CAB11|nr:hypothetical protein [Micromonospora sp. CPM1]MCO1616773.1 hypothetical protein [Micromonospora sp. CPM1]
MSSDAGPSSASERLAALALAYYATDPRVEGGYSRLLGRETYELDRIAVARVLAPLFFGRYYVEEDPTTYAETVVRLRRGDLTTAEPVRAPEVRALICTVLANLPDPPADASRLLRHAVEDTRALARLGFGKRPRLAFWVRDVLDEIVACIDDEPRPETPYVVEWRKPRKPATPPPDKVDEAARKAAERDAQADASARRFLGALAPGRHEVPAVWTAYAAATPEGDRLGKHAFMALARHLLGEPRKIRGARLWVVPEPAVLAEVTERVARLAWADQRVILARFLVQQRTARKAAT